MESESDQSLNEMDPEIEIESVDQHHDQRYIVLTKEDIRNRQEEDISNVSSLLSISREQAISLLRHFKWNASKLNDEWFANEESIRKIVGLQETPIQTPTGEEIECVVCSEKYPSTGIYAAPCGHAYCFTCWQDYIGASINNGPGCLNVRCPEPSCSIAVTQDMIDKLAKDEDKEKIAQYALMSYVEGNKKIKFCPSSKCDCAVEFLHESSNYDVSCNCSFEFCWNCTEEAHQPVDCKTVANWILKNNVESENVNWIFANAQRCPKCTRPIEKTGGGIHITCIAPCNFEFCWLCLEAWDKHALDNWSCTVHESAKNEGTYNEAEIKIASKSSDRYTHCYKRWVSFQWSRMKALRDLNEMKNKKITELSNNIRESDNNLKFIIEAWQQIVECMRVLQWSYAYGYYITEDEVSKIHLLEYLQGELESNLNQLHTCAEKELRPFLCMNDLTPQLLEDFSAFRVKLANLTNVTKSHLRVLELAFENGQEGASSSTRLGTSQDAPRPFRRRSLRGTYVFRTRDLSRIRVAAILAALAVIVAYCCTQIFK